MIVYDEYLINLHDFILYHVNLYYMENLHWRLCWFHLVYCADSPRIQRHIFLVHNLESRVLVYLYSSKLCCIISLLSNTAFKTVRHNFST